MTENHFIKQKKATRSEITERVKTVNNMDISDAKMLKEMQEFRKKAGLDPFKL